MMISTVPWDDVGHYIRFSATFAANGPEEEARIINEIKIKLIHYYPYLLGLYFLYFLQERFLESMDGQEVLLLYYLL